MRRHALGNRFRSRGKLSSSVGGFSAASLLTLDIGLLRLGRVDASHGGENAPAIRYAAGNLSRRLACEMIPSTRLLTRSATWSVAKSESTEDSARIDSLSKIT